MTLSEENERYRNIYQDTVEESEALENDIRELQDKIGTALDYYLELKQKYGELGGWEMVENKLDSAMFWAETPLDIWEDEE